MACAKVVESSGKEQAMEIPAVQNLVNATLNPMTNLGHDASSITAQSAEPVATGEESGTTDSRNGSAYPDGSQKTPGSHLDEKA